jgi:hypothetical protein
MATSAMRKNERIRKSMVMENLSKIALFRG